MYLLTGKAYCDCCKAPLVGKSGTGRHGGFYTYYACKNMVAHKCDLKRIPQAKLEQFVAEVLKKFVMDQEMVDLLVDVSLKAQEEKSKTSEATMLRNQLKDVESKIANIMKVVEAGTVIPEMLDRVKELSAEKEKLSALIASREHMDKLDNLTREEMLAAFQLLQEGEIQNDAFQELLYNMLLNSVYVGKDKIKIVLKYKKDESSTIELPFDPDNIPEVEGSSKRIWWTFGELKQTPSKHNRIEASIRLFSRYAVIELPRSA